VARKVEILTGLEGVLTANNIRLYTCCEKDALRALPQNSTIRPSSCISHDLLAELFGQGLPFTKDYGQRRAAGCECMASVDVGSYRMHPCFHNCLFCYANPAGHRPADKESGDAHRFCSSG
jgi:hypothetical protein